MTTAAEVRDQALTELMELAGPERFPLGNLHAGSVRILRNRALRRHADDPAMIDHIWEIMPLARGDSVALHDAAGVPERPEPRPEPTTVADIQELFRG